VTLLLAASTAAGCGSKDDSSAASGTRMTTLDVSVIPIVHVAPLYLGIEKGFPDLSELFAEGL
jgi:NitT/TauT family transport system substrate-binding protein